MIRPATSVDAAWITDLWNAVIDGSLITFTTVPKTQAGIAELITTRPVFVLSDQGGFATYGPFRDGPGYSATVEHTVMLAPHAQGMGQGRALMTYLMDHGREAGKHIMVAGISGANPGAVAFHERLGFQQVGHMPEVGRKAQQWLDLILMQKHLNPPDSAAHTR